MACRAGSWCSRLKAVLLLLLLLTSVAPVQAQSKRFALVIGNANYAEKPLRNPRNDAADVAAVLRQAGVATTLAMDLGRVEMNRTVGRFLTQAEGADLVFVYYSGHGMQTGGESFLIPVDARIESERDIRSEGLRLGDLMDDLEARRIRRTVVVLDACRDSPFSVRTRGGKRGLAPPKEMSSAFLVAYATADGKTADDGVGRNGVYTSELLKHLGSAGRSLRDVLEETELGVEVASSGAQRPVTYGSTARFRDQYLVARASQPAGESAIRPSLTEQPALVPFATTLPASPATATVPAKAGQAVKDCAACPELVAIAGGEFMMGSPGNEQERDGDESPQRRVKVAAFLAGKYEVTFDEWESCVTAGGCSHKPGDEGWGRGRRPVINVSWDDAQGYVKWLSEQTGKGYRLLSEAEWEYVARAGTSTAYWWPGQASHDRANYGNDQCCGGLALGKDQWVNTAPVGSFGANPFGLHDTAGNVYEWVQDVWHDTYSGAPTDGSAWVTGGDQARRVLRGGSWVDSPWTLRSADRSGNSPVTRVSFTGFRIARTF